MDPGGMLLEDFGQRVDLTRRIREVLANYPEATTALRELIQNADDVRLCLDLRAHSAYSLLAPALAQWQGPALLAHNDAAFTDDDFASISRIGGSKKTGRFGTYHKDEQKQGSSLGMELMVDGGAGGWMSRRWRMDEQLPLVDGGRRRGLAVEPWPWRRWGRRSRR